MSTNILLTGRPGIGKTTVIQNTLAKLEKNGVGFYTREIKTNNKRVGFEVVSVQTDEKLTLAHIDYKKSKHRIGKYGVKPENLIFYLKELNNAIDESPLVVLVIDEIGKMEFFTPGFKEMVEKIVNSQLPFIGTIMKKTHEYCDALKNRSDTKVIEVTKENRDLLPKQLAQTLNCYY